MVSRAGFEPASAGVKVLCLTAWLPGNMLQASHLQVVCSISAAYVGTRLPPFTTYTTEGLEPPSEIESLFSDYETLVLPLNYGGI